jgi:predicted MFS family arabinose efflux permease
MQGLLAAIFAVANVGAPLVGGAITDLAGWRWIFYVNLPVGLVAFLLTAVSLRLPRFRGPVGIDFTGAVLLAATIVPVLLATEWGGRTYAWTSTTVLSLAVTGLLACVALVCWESRTAHPILPLRLFAHPTLRYALPSTLILGATVFGGIVFLPTFLQAAYGVGPTWAGLGLLPYTLTFVAVAAVAGNRAGTSGQFTAYLLTGGVIVGTGFWLLSRMGPDTTYPALVVSLVVLGLGFGLLLQNLVVVAQNSVPPEDLAVTTSTALSLRSLGMSLGGALFANLLARELAGKRTRPPSQRRRFPRPWSGECRSRAR